MLVTTIFSFAQHGFYSMLQMALLEPHLAVSATLSQVPIQSIGT